MEFTFSLNGDRVEEQCRALERHLDAELRGAIEAGGRIVRDAAKAGHAYQDRTGDLTRSIRTLPTTGRTTDGTLSGGATATTAYAGYVEHGTSRTRPYQYLFTAWYLNRGEIAQRCQDAIDNAVFRAGLR